MAELRDRRGRDENASHQELFLRLSEVFDYTAMDRTLIEGTAKQAPRPQ
jgi:hypothetical protein